MGVVTDIWHKPADPPAAISFWNNQLQTIIIIIIIIIAIIIILNSPQGVHFREREG